MAANPYSTEVETHPAFGRVDDGARETFAALTRHQGEQLLASESVQKGTFGQGYLMLTTHGIRFKQTNGRKRNDVWPVVTPIRFERSGTMAFALVDGASFAGTGVDLQQFVELCQLVARAVQWDLEHRAPS